MSEVYGFTYNEARSSIPVIVLQKEEIRVSINDKGFSLMIGEIPPLRRRSKKQTRVTSRIIEDASNIASRVYLSLLGISMEDNIELRFILEYEIDMKADNLDHLIEKKRIDSAEKLQFRMNQQSGTYTLKKTNSPSQPEYVVTIRLEQSTPSPSKRKSKRKGSVTIRFTRQTTVGDLNLEGTIEEMSNIMEEASVLLGI